jgi:hypothetical protein
MDLWEIVVATNVVNKSEVGGDPSLANCHFRKRSRSASLVNMKLLMK